MKKQMTLILVIALIVTMFSSINVFASGTPPFEYPSTDTINSTGYPYFVVFQPETTQAGYTQNAIQVLYSKMPITVRKNSGKYYFRTSDVDYSNPSYLEGRTMRFFCLEGDSEWRVPQLATEGYVQYYSYYDNDMPVGEGADITTNADIFFTNHDIEILDESTGAHTGTYIQEESPVYYTNMHWISPIKIEDVVDHMTFRIQYDMVIPPDSTSKADLTLKITGGVEGSGSVVAHDFEIKNNKWYGLLTFDRQLYPNQNDVTVTMYYKGSAVDFETITVTYFADFLDEDSDGLDDRTGTPEYIPTEPVHDGFEDSGNWISDALSNLNLWLNSSADWITTVGRFFGALFGFLPLEVRTGLTVLMSVTIIFTIFKVIRG